MPGPKDMVKNIFNGYVRGLGVTGSTALRTMFG